MEKRLNEIQKQLDALEKKIMPLLAEVMHFYNLRKITYSKTYFDSKKGVFITKKIPREELYKEITDELGKTTMGI
jgi:hypothetical protein